MAIRQYIGARYVPRFMGTYDPTQIYDALDVVDNGSGTTYIARKTVPANTPLTDTEYWLIYGSSSGAILDLQTRMGIVENAIVGINNDLAVLGDDDIYSRLHNKKIIVLGDSLSTGSGSAAGYSWPENIATLYGATVINEALSGSPIGGSDPDSMLSRLPAILAAHSECDIFVISGGANDKNRNIAPGSAATTSTLTTSGALKYIIRSVQGKYKEKCKILVMTTFHRYDDYNSLGHCEYDYVQAVMNSAAMLGIPCFNNYDSSGISLIADASNAWADVGYIDSGTRSYHFSKEAFEYLTPLYAAYLATGLGNSCAVSPNYLNDSGNNAFYYRGNNQDGFGYSLMKKTGVSFTVTDVGTHQAFISGVTFNIPANYAVDFITAIEATIVMAGWSAKASITGYTLKSDHSIDVTVSGLINYGSTAPTSPQTGEVFIRVDGILNS